jgi:hypothetical protein
MMFMGFLDKLKKAIGGGKDKADEAKVAAAKAEAKVDESADKAKRDAEKSENAIDEASDELKKE